MKFFTMAKDVLVNLIRGPVTRNYPAVSRPPFEGERGKLVMDENLCIFCGLCARKCPSHALTVTRKPDASWKFERFRCILCGSCVEACPKKCLHLIPRNAPDPFKSKD